MPSDLILNYFYHYIHPDMCSAHTYTYSINTNTYMFLKTSNANKIIKVMQIKYQSKLSVLERKHIEKGRSMKELEGNINESE